VSNASYRLYSRELGDCRRSKSTADSSGDGLEAGLIGAIATTVHTACRCRLDLHELTLLAANGSAGMCHKQTSSLVANLRRKRRNSPRK
jgi:hypothetical protein